MRSLLRFLFVGILNTVWGYLLIFGFMYYLEWSPELSNAMGYMIAFVTSYLLHRVYTFESQNQIAGEFSRYTAVFAFAFAMNFAALYIMVREFDWNPYASQIFAGLVYISISFLLNKHMVFSRSRTLE